MSWSRFGAANPKPTWKVLPSEREKMPGLVTVTNPEGRVIATIDPITRKRRSPSGKVQSVLSPQGFSLDGKEVRKISFERTTPWGLVPEVPRR